MNRLHVSSITALILAALLPVNALDIDVVEHTLSNGLKILAVERPDSPSVAFALYYRVGSVDEQPGKTGLAHYVEHMMFKSTKNLQGEAFARIMATVGGGRSNASTSFDRTCYHQTVAPDRLELVIRLEAERMENLKPTPEEAAAELDVVLEELRMTSLDNPQGRMQFLLNQHAFQKHPYQTSPIGRLEDVSTFTMDDLMAFYEKYYVPNNAVAVFVGNFDTDNLLELMETHFGRIRSGRPVVREFPQEPEQNKERRFELDMPVQRSMLWMGYHAPPAKHPDNLALRVLSMILSRGGSSPFGQLAHGQDPVAMFAAAWCRHSLEPGLFSIVGRTLPGISPETLLELIDEIISDVIENGVSEEQLNTAKTQLLAFDVYRMQSNMGIARFLGEYEMVSSWKEGMAFGKRLNELTPECILRVAETYLVSSRRTIGIAMAEQDHPDNQTSGNDTND